MYDATVFFYFNSYVYIVQFCKLISSGMSTNKVVVEFQYT